MDGDDEDGGDGGGGEFCCGVLHFGGWDVVAKVATGCRWCSLGTMMAGWQQRESRVQDMPPAAAAAGAG